MKRNTTTLAIIPLLISLNLNAQDSDLSAEEKNVDEGSETLLITGSRIRGNDAASSVTVMTREDIKALGLSNGEDIIRSLPQNFSNVNAGTATAGSLASFDQAGISVANLRGLGSNSTLILINGRRAAGSANFDGQTINLNSIPAAAIERVEIMLDGASAIYGADAMAGVINFILRKDFFGGETSIRHENSSNEGDVTSFDQTFGFDWDSGRVLMSGRYSKSKGVNARKAGFTTRDLTSFGGSDRRTPGGLTGEVLLTVNGALFGLTPEDLAGSGFDFNFIPAIPLGSLPDGNDGRGGVAANLLPPNSGLIDLASQQSTSDSDSISVHINMDQELSSKVTAFAELNYVKSESENRGGASAFLGVVPQSNAFNDFDIDGFSTLFFGAPGLFTGIFVANTFSDAAQIRAAGALAKQENLSATIGINAELPFMDWNLDFSLTTGKDKTSATRIGLDQQAPGLLAALADSNPATALNVFGDPTAADVAILNQYIVPGAQPGISADLLSSILSVEGKVLDLPAGEMRLAMGTEYRTQGFDQSNVPSRGGNLKDSSPSQDLIALFAETSIPLVEDHLDLTLAARWEEYSVEGPFGTGASVEKRTFTNLSPQARIAWSVTSELKLRAAWGESFRAPSLSQVFQIDNIAPNLGGFPVFDPVTNTNVVPLFVNSLGNPDLKPEISENITAGLEWAPLQSSALDGLFVSVSYNSINFENLIGRNSLLPPEIFYNDPTMAVRNGAGMVIAINNFPINIASRESASWDSNINYSFQTAVGKFMIGVAGTYTIKLEDIAVEGAEPVVLDGTDLGPEKFKGRFTASWNRDNYGANLFIHYSRGYNYNNFFSGELDIIDSYTTVDLTGHYSFDDSGWEINAGIRNLLEPDFPFFDGDFPWDPRRVDTRGRVMFLEVTKLFDF